MTPPPRWLTLLAWLSPVLVLGSEFPGYDTNANGVSDIWEARYGLENPSAGTDQDGDGVSDRREAEDGTNPFDPDSKLRLRIEAKLNQPLVLSWLSRTGKRYQVESMVAGGEWSALPGIVSGSGDMSRYPITTPVSGGFYRLAVVENEPLNPQIEALLAGRDTDGDGVEDWVEWRAGTSLTDPAERFEVESMGLSNVVTLEWPTEAGWSYRLEAMSGGEWFELPGSFRGDGQPARHTVEAPAPNGIHRLVVEALDEDSDGLLDWEEALLGLDPEHSHSRGVGTDDLSLVAAELQAGGQVAIEASDPVVVAGSGGVAKLRLRRANGFKAVTVPLVYSGSAFEAGAFGDLPSEAVFSFGATELEIPFQVAGGFAPGGSLDLVVSLNQGTEYEIEGDPSRTVTLLVENLINVRDYGVTGDGVTDDRDALQAVLEMLEASPEYNGLYFPAGTYRLASWTGDTSAPTGSRRVLKFGAVADLGGRDLVFRGEPGAVLYSDLGSGRAHMLMILAGFRSLLCEDLRFEQDPAPLSPVPGSEPNGSDGVTLLRQDERRIAGVGFKRCSFVNCHRSISVYGTGYDVRGLLENLTFESCEFLNPYGANTILGEYSWGGGQQTYLTPWVGNATYQNCLFEGGGEDMTDPGYGTGGRLKDGSHFGSPLHLTFTGNVVRRMGIEACYQKNDNTFMGWNAEAFTVPGIGDGSTVTINIRDTPSTYPVGAKIVIRSPLVPGGTPSNTLLTVEAHDPVLHTLELSNPGIEGSLPPGSSIDSGKFIYLDETAEPTTARVEDCLFDGTIPPGGVAFPSQKAIVIDTRGRVGRNAVVNFGRGITNYQEAHTPLHPAARGLVIEDNLVLARDPRPYGTAYSLGIDVWGGDERVRGNRIVAEVGYRSMGIRFNSRGAVVADNRVEVNTIQYNGYYSSNRTVGIAISPTSGDITGFRNATRGWDVGTGPSIRNEGRSFWLYGYTSILDALAVDPAGWRNSD